MSRIFWAYAIGLGLSVTLLGAPVLSQQSELSADERFDLAVEAVHAGDYAVAISGFTALAETDAPDAQFNLALLLKTGLGQPKNYIGAYYWAVLSDLGREHRAVKMVTELAAFLPVEKRSEVHQRIIKRLSDQLADGNRSAILKYARIHAEFLEEPDFETAYIWYSIAQALAIRGGAQGSAAMVDNMEPAALIAAQAKAQEIFLGSPFGQRNAMDPQN